MQNRIDKVLKEQGKTYKDMTALTGLSDFEVRDMVNGHDDNTLGRWVALANALHVSPAYLAGWSDEPSEDEHKYDIESSAVFKAYMSKLEPEPYYDFAKSKPTSGIKVTLDDGRIIYDSREMDDMMDACTITGDWVYLKDCRIAKSHIVSIEKVGAES